MYIVGKRNLKYYFKEMEIEREDSIVKISYILNDIQFDDTYIFDLIDYIFVLKRNKNFK